MAGVSKYFSHENVRTFGKGEVDGMDEVDDVDGMDTSSTPLRHERVQIAIDA